MSKPSSFSFELNPEELGALGNATHAADEKGRHESLTNVAVCVGKSALYAVATDSYMLAVVHIKDQRQSRKPFQVIVPAKELRRVVKETSKISGTCTLVVTADSVELVTSLGSALVKAAEDDCFPDWTKIVRKEVERKEAAVHHVTLNGQFVARIAKALSCDYAVGNGLVMALGPSNQPVLVGPGIGKSFGLIMPVRDAFVPATTYTVAFAGDVAA